MPLNQLLVTVTRTDTVEVSLELAAVWFANLDDDSQCKFFVEVAKEAAKWGAGKSNDQWYRVGSHLKNCECSTFDAQNLISEIHNGLIHGHH